MNDQPDTLEISQTMADIAESSQKLVADFLARQSGSPPGSDPGDPGSMDPYNIGGAFIEMTTRMMADPVPDPVPSAGGEAMRVLMQAGGGFAMSLIPRD